MKIYNTIFFILTFCFCCIVCASSQTLEPTDIKSNVLKLYCKKGSIKPYTGCIAGEFNVRKEKINIANCCIIIPSYHTIYDSVGTTFESLYIVGKLYKGKEIGKWLYYKNNQENIFIEAIFANGYMNGLYKEYYPNGSVHYVANYKHNQLHGLSVYYDEHGNIVKIYEYNKGLIVKEYHKFLEPILMPGEYDDVRGYDYIIK